jgi:hypothetical protein
MLHALYGAVSIWLAKVSAPLPLSTAKEATVMVSWFPTTSHSCSPAPGTSLKLRGTRPGAARAHAPAYSSQISDGAINSKSGAAGRSGTWLGPSHAPHRALARAQRPPSCGLCARGHAKPIYQSARLAGQSIRAHAGGNAPQLN